jgi:hypothetical protein
VETQSMQLEVKTDLFCSAEILHGEALPKRDEV